MPSSTLTTHHALRDEHLVGLRVRGVGVREQAARVHHHARGGGRRCRGGNGCVIKCYIHLLICGGGERCMIPSNISGGTHVRTMWAPKWGLSGRAIWDPGWERNGDSGEAVKGSPDRSILGIYG